MGHLIQEGKTFMKGLHGFSRREIEFKEKLEKLLGKRRKREEELREKIEEEKRKRKEEEKREEDERRKEVRKEEERREKEKRKRKERKGAIATNGKFYSYKYKGTKKGRFPIL
ncbi:hypothetical protein V8G54_028757 [Vigna mungo]|uniref:Uncharacterized protein n=1 Tax=Vigna mungo TaxID=3915 RepID=A0AAQ3MT65_VIGMU